MITFNLHQQAFTDHSDLVARRMGFIPLPLGVLSTRIVSQSVKITDYGSVVIFFLAYLCLVSFRILSNIITLGKACDLIDTHQKQRVVVFTTTSPSSGPVPPIGGSPRVSRPEKRGVSPPDVEVRPSSCEKAPEPFFTRSMSIDGALLAELESPERQALKVRSVSHSPPRINRRVVRQKVLRAKSPPQMNELGCQPMFSNSTVSLTSICLNEEIFDEPDHSSLRENTISEVSEDPRSTPDELL